MYYNKNTKKWMKVYNVWQNTKKSSQKKVPANLEQDACAYFRMKNNLAMFELWREIKPPKKREENVSLPFDNKRKNLLFIYLFLSKNILKFRT